MFRTRHTKNRFLSTVLTVGLGLSAGVWTQASSGNTLVTPSNLDLECSANSLRGAYAIQGAATFVPPGAPLPFTLVAAVPVQFQNLTTFDGHGHVATPTGVDTVGGLIEPNVPTVGTYTVHPDCTGEMILQTNHAPQFGGAHVHHLFLTVVGKKFYFTFTDPGAVGAGVGERVRALPE